MTPRPRPAIHGPSLVPDRPASPSSGRRRSTVRPPGRLSGPPGSVVALPASVGAFPRLALVGPLGALVGPLAASLLGALALLLLASLALAAPVLAHGGTGPPPTDPLSIATAWVFDPLPVIGIVVSTVLYLWAVRRVNRAHPGNQWPRLRTAFFLVGIASVAAALISPLDGLADDLSSVHMIQHSVLIFVGAACLVASGVATLALRVATPSARDRWLLPFLHSRFVQALTFPLVGWFAMIAVMWGTHFSDLYDLALRDETVHSLEHLAFLGAALLFWTPIFSPDPLRWRLSHPAKILYLLSQMPTMSWLAVSILNASVVLWPTYLARTPYFGISALADQQLSGAIMWGLGDGAFMVAILLVIADWMKQDEKEAAREDARLDRDRSARASIDARASALAARKAAAAAAAGSAAGAGSGGRPEAGAAAGAGAGSAAGAGAAADMGGAGSAAVAGGAAGGAFSASSAAAGSSAATGPETALRPTTNSTESPAPVAAPVTIGGDR